jgi:hypothetical protein
MMDTYLLEIIELLFYGIIFLAIINVALIIALTIIFSKQQ